MKSFIPIVVLLGTVLAAPKDFASTASDLDARSNADTDAAARCTFASFHTKAKCKHHCHGGGTCEHGTINGHSRWTCFCPLADVEARAAEPEPKAAEPAIEARAEDAAARHCKDGFWDTKKICKKHCHGDGKCHHTINPIAPWACVCGFKDVKARSAEPQDIEARTPEPGPEVAEPAIEERADDAAARRHCKPGFWDTKKICKHHCHGNGHCSHTINPIAPWACVCPLSDVEARDAAPEPAPEAIAEEGDDE